MFIVEERIFDSPKSVREDQMAEKNKIFLRYENESYYY